MKLNNKQLIKHLEFLQAFYFMMWKQTDHDDIWYEKKQQIIIIKEQIENLNKINI